MNRRMPKYKKVNIIVTVLCLLLIGCFSIGYSIMSSNLNANTTVTIRADKNIRITGISTPTLTNGAYEQYNPRYTEDTTTTNVYLPNLNSIATYSITITNSSNTSYDIQAISLDVFNNASMEYSLSNLTTGTVIGANTSKVFTIQFKYKSTVTSIPDNTLLGTVLHLTFEEYTGETLAYASGSMLLNLKGTTAPSNSTWRDTENNHSFTLSNVTYDSSSKSYNFATNGYATLGAPLIPSTGDFTLEAYFLSSSTITSSDQSIVAQVSDTSNDAGRIKFDALNSNLLLFVSTQTSSNKILYFTSSLAVSTRYLLQVVRTGDTYNQYINGVLVRTTTIPASNTISQGPLKLARWTNTANQHFAGSIFAVRLYNRALNATELANNYDVDANTYPVSTQTNELLAYATTNQVVTSNSGLYNTSTNTYLYRGDTPNNYIKFPSSDDIYRIIGFYSDGKAKLVNTSFSTNLAFDDAGNRNVATSTYCAAAADSGCNYYGTNANYNNLTITNDSTIKTNVDTWYSGLNQTIKNKIVQHTFDSGFVEDTATYANAFTEAASIQYTGYAGLISMTDILNASINPITTLSTAQIVNNNYLVSMVPFAAQYWTMNGSANDTWDVWVSAYGTQLSRKKASRTSQMSGSTNSLFYMLPSIYIDSNSVVSGTGTSDDPFIIVG
jgi:hypothetical protein